MVPDCIRAVPDSEWQKLIGRAVTQVRLRYPHVDQVLCDPEDLQQQAWVWLYEAAAKYDPNRRGRDGQTAKFTTFAFRYILRLLGRQIELSNKRSVDTLTEASGVIDTGHNVTLETEEVASLAFQAMDNLPPSGREVVQDHVIDGLTFREIGEKNNRHWTTFSKRYYRSIDRMRRDAGLRNCGMQEVQRPVRENGKEGGVATRRRSLSHGD